MRRDPRNVDEYRKARDDTFASVIRSFNEMNRSFHGIAVEMTDTSKKSVGRAIEIQAQLAKKAYETYLSEVSKLCRMFLSGYGTLVARAETFPSVSLSRDSATAQGTAPHRVSTKRKTGKVAKRQSRSKRPQAKK
jgi:hypothetical protein